MRWRTFQGVGSVLWLSVAGQVSAQPEDVPPIGTVDFFGLYTVSENDVRALLPFEEGDDVPLDLPASFSSELAVRLDIARVELDFGCCDPSGLATLYVGVQEETPGSSVAYNRAPSGGSRLPPEVIASYRELKDRLVEAVMSGYAREDRSRGHALSSYAPARMIQDTHIVYAVEHRGILVEVLHDSADAEHRAAAAWILGYAANKADVVGDLERAVLDPDNNVRNNATRALAVIAQYAGAHPELGIDIRAELFIDMLSSIIWSDRNKGLLVLDPLTESRELEILAELRDQALEPLIEMCGWKLSGHASSACLILQRIGGLPDSSDPSSRDRTIARGNELLARGDYETAL